MARPRLQGVSAIRSEQPASTYPVSRQSPGQDGDSRAPVLIKPAATERHFLNHGSETPIDCQAISLSTSRHPGPIAHQARSAELPPTSMPRRRPSRTHVHAAGRPGQSWPVCWPGPPPQCWDAPLPAGHAAMRGRASCEERHGGSSAMDQQLAKVFVAPLADTEQARLSAGRSLARYEPQPGRQVPSACKGLTIADRGDQRRRIQHSGSVRAPTAISLSNASIRRSSARHSARRSWSKLRIRGATPEHSSTPSMASRRCSSLRRPGP